MIVLFAAACSTPAAPTATVRPTDVATEMVATEAASVPSDEVIDSKALAKEFTTDATAANAKYNGKTITVRGVVNSMKTQFNAPTILLRESDADTGVSCWFPEESKDAEGLQVRQTVTVKGTIFSSDNVLVQMQNCSVVK
jgi:hypothetical protein